MWKIPMENVWPSLQGLMRLDKIMGKWFLAILVVVFLYDRVSFSDLKRVMKPITNKVLANRLRVLQGFGLLVKRIVMEHPLRVEYYLTEKGKLLARDLASVVGLDRAQRAPILS